MRAIGQGHVEDQVMVVLLGLASLEDGWKTHGLPAGGLWNSPSWAFVTQELSPQGKPPSCSKNSQMQQELPDAARCLAKRAHLGAGLG